MDEPLKLCIDCKWMRRTWLLQTPMCSQPDVSFPETRETKTDMVTGTVTEIVSKAVPVTCHGAREYRILCGPQARYFEPKFKETT